MFLIDATMSLYFTIFVCFTSMTSQDYDRSLVHYTSMTYLTRSRPKHADTKHAEAEVATI